MASTLDTTSLSSTTSLKTNPAPGASAVPAPHFRCPAQVTLEITRGRTQFRERPVSSPRFLIGSGAECDLRLGGEVLPTVHTLVQTRGSQVWVEPQASEPTLLLNGEPTRGEWLRDGDVLDIGPFRFVAHLPRAPRTGRAAVPSLVPSDAAPGTPPATPLSAAELCALLESELQLVEEFEANQQAGGEALLQTVQRQTPRAQPVPPPALPTADSPENRPADLTPWLLQDAVSAADGEALVRTLDQVSTELQTFAEQLEQRALQLQDRELAFGQAAESLLQAQQQLSRQLETVLHQVQTLCEDDHRGHSGRAIA